MYALTNPDSLSGKGERRSASLHADDVSPVQIKTVNLADFALPAATPTIVNLSDADDKRWAGLVMLPAGTEWTLNAGARHDVYILQGSLSEAGEDFPVGTFITRSDLSYLRSGPEGALLFIYRDSIATLSGNETVRQADLTWHPGSVTGMRVAPLSSAHHRLMLVSWAPGVGTRFHQHPWGEEIFVIKGMLQDQNGRYPAGTWQRMASGSGHRPFTEEDTLILLRNGHFRTPNT